MYCNQCGHYNSDDSKFCNSCGAQLSSVDNPAEATPPPKNEDSVRRTMYEGTVHKCVYCGEILKSFEAVCPSCGHEIRDIKASSIVKELQAKLEKAENDQQRIAIISGFAIPNTKEDILEMMMLSSANLDITIYVDKLHEEDVSDAWFSLLSRCYRKAKSSFGDHPEFSIAQKLYGDVQSKIEEAKAEITQKTIELQKNKEREQKVKAFSKGGGRKLILLLCVLSSVLAIVAFIFGKIIAGLTALLSLGVCVFTLLVGHDIIKVKHRFLTIIFTIVSIVLFLFAGVLLFQEAKAYNGNSIDLETIYLKEQLPITGITNGAVLSNRKDFVHIECSVTPKEYYDYIDFFIKFGYSLDSVEKENSFEAYNATGYFLTLQYSDFLSVMTIKVKEPMSMGDFAWSTSDVAKQLPVPGSSIGKVIVDSDTEYSLYVGNITLEMYSEYIDNAYNTGCNVNYFRGDRTFYSEKKVWFTTFKVQIDYVGYNTIYIKIYKVK